MTFELSDSIKPLITTLRLSYGEILDANAMTTAISVEGIPAGAQGSVDIRELSNLNQTNYQFRLETVIGFYTYESDVVSLYPTTEVTPSFPSSSPTPPISDLPAPMIISVVASSSSSSIFVTWSKIDIASGYVVNYYNENGGLEGVKSVSWYYVLYNTVLERE